MSLFQHLSDHVPGKIDLTWLYEMKSDVSVVFVQGCFERKLVQSDAVQALLALCQQPVASLAWENCFELDEVFEFVCFIQNDIEKLLIV